MKDLDCLGDMCPIPIMKLKEELLNIRGGETVKLVTDHSCVCESSKDFCKGYGLKMEIEEVINGVWEILISK